MREHEIFLIGGADDESIIIVEDESDGLCLLKCECRGHRISAQASDYFKALCQVRTELERLDLMLFCYGASLNVYPSGMSRDMGRGLVAYKLRMGEPGRREDLVGIFDQGPDVIPASVRMQKDYFDEWLRSLAR